jgi:hypothetical protein
VLHRYTPTERESIVIVIEKNFENREEWLNTAADMIASDFTHVFAEHFGNKGLTRLAMLRVSAGFPSRRGENGKVIGQCWNDTSSKDKKHHIFISPLLEKEVEVLATLAHEMVHAADNGENKHKGAFVKAVRDLGLEGKPTATIAGPEFRKWAKTALDTLGKYPHVALRPTLVTKTQKTYMIKVVCLSCDCVLRMTEKWIDAAGVPTCGCGGTMEVEA